MGTKFMMYACAEYEFNFGKMVAKRKDVPYAKGIVWPYEVRFKIKGKKLLAFNGRWWQYGWLDVWSEKEIVEQFEHWQFERIVLK
jgi:hypothetical protein